MVPLLKIGLEMVELRSGRENPGEPGNQVSGNLKVSQEIFIVNPTHLSRKCDTPKTTQFHKKTTLGVG